MPEQALPVVAIVGRPNVGKSALFNAILRRRVSIVHEQSGVTRDRVAAPACHDGHHFLLVDTGGLGVLDGARRNVDLFDGLILRQVTEVLAEAGLLIWVVDCQEGITPQDEEVGAFLHRSGRRVLVCANKADNADLARDCVARFAALGFPEIVPTSCAHTSGILTLLDHAVARIGKAGPPPETDGTPMRIAVVGKPNVGKSSLVNRILGSERMMVSAVAGTTRDAVDLPVTLRQGGETLPIVLVDTAGMRRRRQVDTVVEFFSSNRTEQAIRRSDLVLFVLDSTSPCNTQDRRIGRLIVDAGRPCIVLANKWDLASAAGRKAKELAAEIDQAMPYLRHAPVHAVSALNGYNLKGIFDLLQNVRRQMSVTVPTAILNQFLQDTLLRTPPVSTGTRRFKVYYGTMKSNPPPRFLLFVNSRKLCPANYLQFLENRIREAFFPAAGLPVVLELRERTRLEDAPPQRQAAASAQRRRQQQRHDVQRRIDRSRRFGHK